MSLPVWQHLAEFGAGKQLNWGRSSNGRSISCVQNLPGAKGRASRPNVSRQRSRPCTRRCCFRSNAMRWAENSPTTKQPTDQLGLHTPFKHWKHAVISSWLCSLITSRYSDRPRVQLLDVVYFVIFKRSQCFPHHCTGKKQYAKNNPPINSFINQ